MSLQLSVTQSAASSGGAHLAQGQLVCQPRQTPIGKERGRVCSWSVKQVLKGSGTARDRPLREASRYPNLVTKGTTKGCIAGAVQISLAMMRRGSGTASAHGGRLINLDLLQPPGVP